MVRIIMIDELFLLFIIGYIIFRRPIIACNIMMTMFVNII